MIFQEVRKIAYPMQAIVFAKISKLMRTLQ